MQRWLDRGYATFSMTDRGFRESCGSADIAGRRRRGVRDGYVRLIDNRYEVRDAQEFAGKLADERPDRPAADRRDRRLLRRRHVDGAGRAAATAR